MQEPPRSGFTLALWVLPVLALLAGGGWLIYTIRGWFGQKTAAAPVEAAAAEETLPTVEMPADDYLDQVEKDLGLD